jgi:tetratricopeptide (TPR) repeat protein
MKYSLPATLLRHASIICLIIACLLLLPSQARAATTYSIVLAASSDINFNWDIKKNTLFKGRSLYIEKITIKGSPWQRLCLGYFDNRKQADSVVKDLGETYPDAWVQKTPAKNNIVSINPSVAAPTTGAASKTKSATGVNTSTLTEKQLEDLMLRAKTDFKKKNYSSAIRYLKAIISAGEHKSSREALELLGLSRQRKGQLTHAADIYEKYLKLYPEGEDSDRVRQRLAGLLTASSAPRKKISMATEEKDEIRTYGSVSQYYRTNWASNDAVSSLQTLSQLISFVDLTTMRRSKKYDHLFQITADHAYNFLDSSDNDEVRFIETYYELGYRKTGSSGRFGRQALRIGGILKRFDGLSAGYQLTPDMRFNFLAGFPVDYNTRNTINRQKTFYGFTFETGTFLDHWDANLFFFDQKVDGLTDRTSIGTDIRYYDRTKSLFGMIDYDLFYNEVNMLQLNANFMFASGPTLYLNAFARKSPVLSTSMALSGRAEQSIEELKKVLSVEQIYQLARDRTTNTETLSIGGSQPVSKKFRLTADLTLSQLGDTIASGGVPAIEGTDADYFISAQLVGDNLLQKHDTAVFGVRYYNTSFSSTTSLIANSRFPITSVWRLNPRLQYDIRKLSDGRAQNKIRIMLKTDYQYLKKVRFDFDIAYDETVESSSNRSDISNLYISMGYRWDF